MPDSFHHMGQVLQNLTRPGVHQVGGPYWTAVASARNHLYNVAGTATLGPALIGMCTAYTHDYHHGSATGKMVLPEKPPYCVG
jgi:hypothetical protein